VVGVDLDPRAIAFARFNARLEQIDGARFEIGDLAAPVAGERFDLVLSQPPFVTHPEGIAATTYLHGGRRGDELALRMLGQIPGLLAEAGRALVLFDTADDGEHVQRVLAALGSSPDAAGPLRVIVVAPRGLDADRQALGYAATSHAELGPEYARAVRRYRRHLRELGIESTRHMLVAIERVAPTSSVFAVEIDPRAGRLPDAAELAGLRARLVAAAAPTQELLALRLGVSPHASLVHSRRLGPGEAGDELALRFSAGLARDRELSLAAATLIEMLARPEPATLAELVERYALECEAEAAEVVDGVTRFVRESLASGLLEPS
jgi:hypothetical protein